MIALKDAAGTPWPVDVLRAMAAAERHHRETTRPAGCLTEAEAAVRLLDAATRLRGSVGTMDEPLARKAAFEAMDEFARMAEFWRGA